MAEVIVSSWRWAYESLLPDDFLVSLDPSVRAERLRATMEDPSSRAQAWVAEVGDGIVGAASAGPPLEPAQHGTGEPLDGAGELYLIYVEPGSIGTGSGRALLEASIEGLRAQGFPRAFLWVLEGNERARLFYEKAGWIWDGSRSTHMIDCLNMPVVRYVTEL
jgi:GNAT superfamily N-acetyltransferase